MMRTLARAVRRSAAAAAAALVLASLPPLPAHASGTAPVLTIRSVQGLRSSSGATWVRIEGKFPSEDLVQLDYPLELLIRDATGAFVWFRMPSTAQHGRFAGAATPPGDHLLDDLRANARSGSDQGDVLQLGADWIEVQLGPWIEGTDLEALIFVIYRGHPVFSNPLAFQLEEVLR